MRKPVHEMREAAALDGTDAEFLARIRALVGAPRRRFQEIEIAYGECGRLRALDFTSIANQIRFDEARSTSGGWGFRITDADATRLVESCEASLRLRAARPDEFARGQAAREEAGVAAILSGSWPDEGGMVMPEMLAKALAEGSDDLEDLPDGAAAFPRR